MGYGLVVWVQLQINNALVHLMCVCALMFAGPFILIFVYNFCNSYRFPSNRPINVRTVFVELFDRRYRSLCCFSRLFHVSSFIHSLILSSNTCTHRHLVVWVCVCVKGNQIHGFVWWNYYLFSFVSLSFCLCRRQPHHHTDTISSAYTAGSFSIDIKRN